MIIVRNLAPAASRLLIASAIAALPACRKTTGADPVGGRAQIGFNEHVQPILSEYCYSCHGPDVGSRKAKLRLDRAADAYATRKHGAAIVPGQPDASDAIRRMVSQDRDDIMPPPDAHKAMKSEEIALVRQWIAEGAVYQDHWAFVPPVRPTTPDPARRDWPRNEIDRFILAALEKAGLPPSPEADRRTLIRRVTLDLTGLLPDPAAVEAFAADPATNAYEQLVERLLAEPGYGEHRARYWLDYVRYADTHGIHFDNYRSIWPYRDYVVRAFNENKPFDTFVTEQLAGDLLPPTNLDQIVATGYLRCNQTSNEGGGIPEEFLVNNTRDRVEAYGSAFLGLTVGCASCHDHKFDPTQMKDFYRLAAFFNNTAEPAWDLNKADPPPVARIPPPDQRAAVDTLLARKAHLVEQMRSREADFPRLLAEWLASERRPQPVSTTGLVLRLRLDEGRGDTLHNSAPAAQPPEFKTAASPPAWGEEWLLWPALRMDLGTRIDLGNIGDFERDQPFSAGGWFQIRTEPGGGNGDNVGAFLARMDSPANGYRGWDIFSPTASTPHTSSPNGRTTPSRFPPR